MARRVAPVMSRPTVAVSSWPIKPVVEPAKVMVSSQRSEPDGVTVIVKV